MGMTTIKISTETRDRVKQLGEQTHQTAEEVIVSALDVLARQRRVQRMREEALEVSRDPDDLAEAQQILADVEQARAW